MFSSSLNTLSPHKLFAYDCVTLYNAQCTYRAMMLKPEYEIPMDSATQLIKANKVT